MADFARYAHAAVQAQLDRLPKMSPAGDRLGLERIGRLLEKLGRPQDFLPPVFHVAGTNGKGSTCAFLRAALEASGRKVHVFTSPHLVRFNERIRLAGNLIEDEQLADLLGEVLDAGDFVEPSFFEVATAVALLAFARVKADACILEVGLGGRLDATNIVERPLVCGIAGLGLDHQQYLGDDLASIAREKAGIAKPGVPLVCLEYAAEVLDAIAEIAEVKAAPLYPAGHGWTFGTVNGHLQFRDRGGIMMLPMPVLPGPHQLSNCALAIAMLRHQDRLEISFEALRRAPTRASWPARMLRLSDGPLSKGVETWVDGAHNIAAAQALADTLAEREPMHVVLGILATKDAEAIIGALRDHALSMTFVPVASHPYHDPNAPAQRFGGRAAATLEMALADLSEPRLIAGSLYLAGEALALNGDLPD